MDAIIDKFGRIVIPKKVRDDYNLRPGTHIRIEEMEGSIILKPIEETPNLIDKEGVLVFSCASVGDLESALDKHREERITEFGAGFGDTI